MYNARHVVLKAITSLLLHIVNEVMLERLCKQLFLTYDDNVQESIYDIVSMLIYLNRNE